LLGVEKKDEGGKGDYKLSGRREKVEENVVKP